MISPYSLPLFATSLAVTGFGLFIFFQHCWTQLPVYGATR